MLLLQERFTYTGRECNSTPVHDCSDEDEGVVCGPPLWATEQLDNDDRSEYAEKKCDRGRAWRWASFGGLGVAGACAVLGATLCVPLARRARRSSVPQHGT